MQVHLTTQAVKERAVAQDYGIKGKGQCLHLDDASVAIQINEQTQRTQSTLFKRSIGCCSLDMGLEVGEVERCGLGF